MTGERQRVRYSRYAKATFSRIGGSIRLSRKDREGIQKRALQEGLPYQPLLSSLLHVTNPLANNCCWTQPVPMKECRDSAVFLWSVHIDVQSEIGIAAILRPFSTAAAV
jgi:hypothetical protein